MTQDITPFVDAWLDEPVELPEAAGIARVAELIHGTRQQRRWWPFGAASGGQGSVTATTRSMLSPARAISLAALFLALGGAVHVAEPFGRPGETLPGVGADPAAAAPVEFTATIDYRGSTQTEAAAGFPVSSSDPRFEGVLIWTSSARAYPGADIEVGVTRTRIENAGGAWQAPPGIQLNDLPDDESPRQARREPEPHPVSYLGVDGYEGLYVVAEATWDVWTLQSDLHGYIFEGDPPADLRYWIAE